MLWFSLESPGNMYRSAVPYPMRGFFLIDTFQACLNIGLKLTLRPSPTYVHKRVWTVINVTDHIFNVWTSTPISLRFSLKAAVLVATFRGSACRNKIALYLILLFNKFILLPMSGKQCRSWSDAAFCGVWSGSTLLPKGYLSQYTG